ncbi:MAG: septum formation protein Maf [Alphaproteobacteria bacterium]|nr:septum formation protein Maf [Alphaproteobacteria bacterium]
MSRFDTLLNTSLPFWASPDMALAMPQPPLILASRSPRRRALLATLGVPFTVQSADVDETPLRQEGGLAYVQRVAALKARAIAAQHPGCVVLAADTPVLVGRRILQTPATAEAAAAMLRLQSNRRVQVPTAVVVIDATGKERRLLVPTWLKLKVLCEAEIAAYVASGHWQGCSGGLKGELIEHWLVKMYGSRSGYLGLPLYETAKLLRAAGLAVALVAASEGPAA